MLTQREGERERDSKRGRAWIEKNKKGGGVGGGGGRVSYRSWRQGEGDFMIGHYCTLEYRMKCIIEAHLPQCWAPVLMSFLPTIQLLRCLLCS